MKFVTPHFSCISFVLFATFLIQSAIAQTEESQANDKSGKFSLAVGLGYGRSFGESAKGGALFSVEPAFQASHTLRLGIRFQHALLVRGIEGIDSDDFNDAPISSLLFNFQFRLLHDVAVKPFLGVGAGWYFIKPVNVDVPQGTYDLTQSSNEFGGNIRLGAEVKKFFFAVEYNLVPETNDVLVVGPDMIGTVTAKNNFLGISVGYVINGR